MITKLKYDPDGNLVYLGKMWNVSDGKISTIFNRVLDGGDGSGADGGGDGQETVIGLKFHPSESEIFVTYGKNHLMMWQMDQSLMVIIFRNDIMISVST